MTELADIYEDLRKPFTPEATKFKVQATWATNAGGAQIVAYIDARLVSARLNKLCPNEWSSKIYPGDGGAICELTVCGQTRTDFGKVDYVDAKGNFSDALKRAAVHFGIAESLYYLPRMILNVGNGVKEIGQPGKNGKPRLAMTPQGMKICRQTYTDWLETVGKDLFGVPLDHGDQLADDPDHSSAEYLGTLIAQSDFNPDQVENIRAWAKNGNGLDPNKVTKAIALIEIGEEEVLLERAGA